MKTKITGASVIRLLVLIAFGTVLSSFSSPLGTDSYKVYLNDKLLFHRYVGNESPLQTISLQGSTASDLITVYYDHCGRIGTQRTLALVAGNDVLKKWTYADAQSRQASGMTCTIGEIKSLQKGGKAVTLVYSSKELSDPFTLASIGADTKASR